MPRLNAVFSAKSFHATLLLPPKPQNGKPTFDFFLINFYDFLLLFRFFSSDFYAVTEAWNSSTRTNDGDNNREEKDKKKKESETILFIGITAPVATTTSLSLSLGR